MTSEDHFEPFRAERDIDIQFIFPFKTLLRNGEVGGVFVVVHPKKCFGELFGAAVFFVFFRNDAFLENLETGRKVYRLFLQSFPCLLFLYQKGKTVPLP